MDRDQDAVIDGFLVPIRLACSALAAALLQGYKRGDHSGDQDDPPPAARNRGWKRRGSSSEVLCAELPER
jgi:hypothetical protein